MKRMSFSLTTDQVRNQTKTVTRRQGWAKLQPGDLVQPIVKGMGLKKGEKQELLGPPIRIVSVTELPIYFISTEDVEREGFPGMTRDEFIEMYCKANKCKPEDTCRRIEFRYVPKFSGQL